MDKKPPAVSPNSTRRLWKRKTLKFFGRLLIRLLTRFELDGEGNLPAGGAYILAGNHVGSIEVLLMVCFSPRVIDVIGTGDFPLDPKLARFANLYGYLPINRGEIDQKGLKAALTVLESGGVLGIFPEGGIWDDKIKPPKTGVSWLCAKSLAPVVPVGFFGVKDALKAALSFKFPRMNMVIGRPCYPRDLLSPDLPMKESLIKAAQTIMERIVELLPEGERQTFNGEMKETVLLRFVLQHPGQEGMQEIQFENQNALSRLIQHPVMMDVFLRNLGLPVRPLTVRGRNVDLRDVSHAGRSILDFLNEKPGFLPYRFGFDEGLRMKAGLEEFIGKIETGSTETQIIFLDQSKNPISKMKI